MASNDLSQYLNSLTPDERARVEAAIDARIATGRPLGSQTGARRGAPLTPAQRGGVASGATRRTNRALQAAHDTVPGLPDSLPDVVQYLSGATRRDFEAAYVQWSDAWVRLSENPNDEVAEGQRKEAVSTIARILGANDRIDHRGELDPRGRPQRRNAPATRRSTFTLREVFSYR